MDNDQTKSNNHVAIDRLAAFVVDEILNMTDEEIMDEIDDEDLNVT